MLALPAVAAARATNERVPIDARDLNDFSKEYNLYITAMNRFVVDQRQWRRVARAWRVLVGG